MCWWLLIFYRDTRQVDLKTKLNKPSFYIARANWNPRLTATSRRLSPITHALRIQKLAITTYKINIPSWQLQRETSFNPCVPWCKALHHVLYIHLACRAAKPRRVHSCRRKRRSANSVAAPTASQRRSRVAASQRQHRRSAAPASQRQQRRSGSAASQRRSVNSAAASLAQRQRCSVTASPAQLAASQRRSATRPPERRSVAAPPAPGSVTAQRRKPTFRPPLPLHWRY